jgi:hypothetical protein
MLGELGREASCNLVAFRLQSTDALLWKAPMQYVPRADELVGKVENGDVATWYKVEQVKYELRYELLTPGGGETPENEVEAPYADVATTVLVSVVP